MLANASANYACSGDLKWALLRKIAWPRLNVSRNLNGCAREYAHTHRFRAAENCTQKYRTNAAGLLRRLVRGFRLDKRDLIIRATTADINQSVVRLTSGAYEITAPLLVNVDFDVGLRDINAALCTGPHRSLPHQCIHHSAAKKARGSKWRNRNKSPPATL